MTVVVQPPMRLGLALPRTPAFALPDPVRRVAAHAESIGFDSLWADDRLLSPLDGPANEAFLDPIGVLHMAAASTTTVALAAALVAPWHSAIVLGRSLTTLDLASGGRLTVALTTGLLGVTVAAALLLRRTPSLL